MLETYRGKKVNLIGRGCNREVYEIEGTHLVVKVPRPGSGKPSANTSEAMRWKASLKNPHERVKLLPCRLMPDGCLLMVRADIKVEYQTPSMSEVGLPSFTWVNNDFSEEWMAQQGNPTFPSTPMGCRSDGFQVGKYKETFRYFDYE